MVLDFGVSKLPMELFMAVHITAFAIALTLAYRAQAAGAPTFLRSAFVLFALAELLYMGYHLEVSTFLLSHTLAEALDLVAFVLAFVGFTQQAQKKPDVPAVRA